MSGGARPGGRFGFYYEGPAKHRPAETVKPMDAEQKFEARLRVFTDKRRRHLLAAGGGALLSEDLHMGLEDYLHISRRRRLAPMPMFKLQIHMVQDLVIAEKNIVQCKQESKVRHEKINQGAPDKDNLEEEMRSIDRELHFQEAEARAIRDIADGIAWRLFEYDRPILTELANRPGTKHINLEGIEAELHELGAVFSSRKGIGVLNDLTHFLKLGDITIRKESGTFELVEVKKGHKTSGRITRQRQALRRAIAFLNTGEREEEEGRILISELEVTPETFHANIGRLTADAEKQGAAIERIGEHLIVECIDFTKIRETGEVKKMEAVMEQTREWVQAWHDNDELVMDFWSQEKYIQIGNYAPFSIFPFTDIARVKLMTGALWLVAYVNISAVLRYFEGKGWKAVRMPEELLQEAANKGSTRYMGLVTVRKGPSTIEVPAPLFGRLGFEFLKPRTLVNAFEEILAAGEPEAPMSFPNFLGEAEIWD